MSNDNGQRLRFYVALDTETIIVVKGDAVFVPERAGTVREEGTCGPVDVVQGHVVKTDHAALRALQRRKVVKHISGRKVPDVLKKTLKHEIGRIEGGKEARVLGLARFRLPWDYALDPNETRNVPPPPKPQVDIIKVGLRRLASKALTRPDDSSE